MWLSAEISAQPNQWDCHRCSPARQIDWGCTQNSPIPDRWQVGENTYQRCPLKAITPMTRKVLDYYPHYRAGHLPQMGGLNDQPAWLMAALAHVHSQTQAAQAKQLDRLGPK